MIWKRVNPYDAPQFVDPVVASETDSADDVQPRLSNRVMALAIGVPAILFLLVGCVFWAEALLGVSVPAGKMTAFLWATIVAGMLLPTVGVAMIAVSVFLWRYGRNAHS